MTLPADADAPVRTREGLIFRPVGSEWVVYDPAADELHALNVTSALIWEMCDGETSVEAMAEAIHDLLEGAPPVPEVVPQVRDALATLRTKGLLA